MNALPRLTIGVPVFNGANYLVDCLDSLTAQTFTDFVLLISDNASTDATQEICRDYAGRDERVRYVRQDRNLGAAPNHNFLVDTADTELFKWSAHDDLFAPALVERCVEGLDAHPAAVLCHSLTGTVDPSGVLLEEFPYAIATADTRPSTRFKSLLAATGGDDFYGVARRDVLRRIAPLGSYHNDGRKLVAELALHGPFHIVPEVLYWRREHPARGDRRGSIPEMCANLDPRRRGQSAARLVTEYVVSYLPAIARAPMSARERALCYQHLVGWFGRRAVLAPLGRGA